MRSWSLCKWGHGHYANGDIDGKGHLKGCKIYFKRYSHCIIIIEMKRLQNVCIMAILKGRKKTFGPVYSFISSYKNTIKSLHYKILLHLYTIARPFLYVLHAFVLLGIDLIVYLSNSCSSSWIRCCWMMALSMVVERKSNKMADVE